MQRISQATLEIGCWFEDECEQLFRKLGYLVNRQCDQKGKYGTKAPMAWGPFDAIRLPDLELIGKGKTMSGDCKYKSRPTRRYCLSNGEAEINHGIDLPNWRDYLKYWEHSGQAGFIVIGEGNSGLILHATAAELITVSREHAEPTPSFPNGGVFWPREVFHKIGRFDPRPINRRMVRFQGIWLHRGEAA
jgi:hypothetical protein